MEQVPRKTTYIIIGNGKLASHFKAYLNLLKLPHTQWSRSSGDSLEVKAAGASHALILISDAAIDPFLQENQALLQDKVCVHCSGSINTPLAYGAHPTMTFGTTPYTLDFYQKIPFVCEATSLPFSEILPGLPNPHFTIEAKLKARYHALCVMSNNFTTLLWQKFYQELKNTLHLPESLIHPFLEATLQNIIESPDRALTGPLTRGDTETIEANLKSLQDDPFQGIYQAFVTGYQNK